MVFTVFEILDMVLMTVIIGYLFKDAFVPPKKTKDVLDYYSHALHDREGWHDFWWACALVAPAIILHELGHKFAALGFGFEATFHAACSTTDLIAGGSFFTFLCNIQILAVIMKAMGVGFLIFVPGFVSWSGFATPLERAIVAFAGPAVHLIFWLGTAYILKHTKYPKKLSDRQNAFLFYFKQINMFLFILNIIPIPGFDGFHIISSLMQIFF